MKRKVKLVTMLSIMVMLIFGSVSLVYAGIYTNVYGNFNTSSRDGKSFVKGEILNNGDTESVYIGTCKPYSKTTMSVKKVSKKATKTYNKTETTYSLGVLDKKKSCTKKVYSGNSVTASLSNDIRYKTTYYYTKGSNVVKVKKVSTYYPYWVVKPETRTWKATSKGKITMKKAATRNEHMLDLLTSSKYSTVKYNGLVLKYKVTSVIDRSYTYTKGSKVAKYTDYIENTSKLVSVSFKK